MSDHDQYVDSLAADLYWAAEQWFRRVDPYHGNRSRWFARWFALRDDLKEPYREAAKKLIEEDARVRA